MKVATCLTLILLVTIPGLTQNTGTGTPSFGSFTGGTAFDLINNQNVNVRLGIPIVALAGRHTGFAFSEINNSQIWMPVASGGTTSWTPVVDFNGNPTWGWQTGNPTGTSSYSYATIGSCSGVPLFHFYNMIYTDTVGTPHHFPTVDLTDTCVNNNVVRQPTAAGDGFTGYASDATGYFLNFNTLTHSPIGNQPTGVVTGPDGVQYYAFSGTGYVEDTNGNWIGGGANSNVTTWTDTTGSTALKITSSSTSVKYQDRNSNVVATVNLQTINIKTNFGCPGVVEYSGTATVPSSIAFPNNQSITFYYEPTPGNSGYYTGRLQKVTLPNAGFYEYDYGATNDGINCSDGTTMSLTRKINHGINSRVWTFSRSGSTTTVTAPQLSYDLVGNDTVYVFDANGHETSRKIYQGSATSGSLLQTGNTTWASNGTPATVVTILDDGSTQSEVDTTYDSNGLLRSSSEYDFGSGAHGALIRSTSYSYLADNNSSYAALNMINLVSNITVKDSDGTAKNEIKFGYDEVAISSSLCPTGVAQNDDAGYGCSFNLRGNVTSVSTYKDPVTPANPVVRNFTYDVFGNTRTAQLNCCQQKSWIFSSTTNYSYPDSVVRGSAPGTQLTTGYVYNGPTDGPEGMVKNFTDENGQITKYTYDTVGRTKTVTRPDNTQILYSYDDTNHKVTVTTPIDSTHSTLQISAADSLGRLSTTTLKDGSGNVSAIVQQQYDELGRPSGQSNPYTGPASSFFSSVRFDALGRPTKSLLPGGGETIYSYSAQTVTVTDPTGKQIRRKMDGAGRLVEVDEPNSASQGTSTSATASVTVSGTLLSTTSEGAGSSSPLATGAGSVNYLDSNQHLISVTPNSSGISSWLDLTSLSGGPAAETGSALGGAGGIYQSPDQHIHSVWWNSSTTAWVNNDLTSISATSVVANAGTPLASFTTAQGSHQAYLGQGNRVEDLFYNNSNGSLTNQDLTTLSSGPAASVSSSLVTAGAGVAYQSTDQHIHSVWWSSTLGWVNNDLTGVAGSSVVARSGTPLGFFSTSLGNHVIYLGQDNHLYDFFYNNSSGVLTNQDLTALSGGPAAAGNSLLDPRAANYQSADLHIHAIWWNSSTSSWVNNDLTGISGTSVLARSGTPLASFATAQGSYVVYIGQDNHVNALFYNYSNGTLTNQDLTASLMDSGTMSLNVGGFTATACFGNSTNAICNGQSVNTTSSQVASALAQALNISSSPVRASASGATITLTWKTAGVNVAPVSALTTTHDNPSIFPNPSFTSPSTSFTGGTSPWFTNAFVTTYTYNVMDQLTGSTADLQTHTQVYDALGRMTSQTTPEAGTVTFQYNDFNLPTQRTDQRGVVTNYSYDGLNRLTGKSYAIPNGSGVTAMPNNICDPTSPAGTNLVANTCLYYDQGGSAAFALGRLTNVIDPSGSEAYIYDQLGRITLKQKTISGATYPIGYQYNLANEITQIQYPSGRQLKPSFDPLGRLAGISDTMGSTNTTYASGLAYNSAQQLTGFNYGNGITATYGYSSDRLQLTSLSYSNSTQTLFSLSYGYTVNGGNNGQITSITDNVDNGRSATYLYDALGRLQQAFTSGSTNYPKWDLAFSYDRYGNRLTETPQPDTSPNVQVPSNQVSVSTTSNQITSAGYGYDLSGNMTNDGVNTMTYDGENRVSSSNGGSAATYIYDAAGLRVKKCAPSCGGSNPSTVYIFSSSMVIAEYDNGAAVSSPSREYINAAGGLLATIDSGGVKYHMRDHLSVRVNTDANGNKLGEQANFPYGEAWYSTNTTTKWRFTSYERDTAETGNDYAQARYYLNRLARFNSPDPVAGSLALPQTLNRYSYVGNDPVRRIDPQGLFIIMIPGGGGGMGFAGLCEDFPEFCLPPLNPICPHGVLTDGFCEDGEPRVKLPARPSASPNRSKLKLLVTGSVLDCSPPDSPTHDPRSGNPYVEFDAHYWDSQAPDTRVTAIQGTASAAPPDPEHPLDIAETDPDSSGSADLRLSGRFKSVEQRKGADHAFAYQEYDTPAQHPYLQGTISFELGVDVQYENMWGFHSTTTFKFNVIVEINCGKAPKIVPKPGDAGIVQ